MASLPCLSGCSSQARGPGTQAPAHPGAQAGRVMKKRLARRRESHTGWLGRSPNHPYMRLPLRNQGFFITLVVSRSGSSMRKPFALCEAFGLTPFGPGTPARRGETAPFPSPWIPSAREGFSAGTGRPGRGHSRAWRRGPPLPALRCAQRGASVATGGCARVRGGGGGRPRPFGMLPWRGREAARRDHQPQLVRELMTRDTRSMPQMPTPKEMNRPMWGCGRSPHPHIGLLLSLRWPFSAAC